jgi:hypothetical protein
MAIGVNLFSFFILFSHLAAAEIFVVYPQTGQRSCAECHRERTPMPRASRQQPGHHDLITKHFTDAKKCSVCHTTGHVERLQLLTGDQTSSIPTLCGQCHGIVKRNWDLGIHGKQSGGWKNSARIDCTRCHNAHDPKFKPMKAKPAPVRPKLGIMKGEANE